MNNESVFDASEIATDEEASINFTESSSGSSSNSEPPKKSESKIQKRLKKIGIITLLSIALFYAIVLIYFKAPVSDYLSASERGFKFPDITKGFIPQGMSYDPASGDFYLTGYMNDGSASPIYIVDKDTGSLEKKILMANPDMSPFCGHSGGITYFDGKIYVAGGKVSCLYIYDPAKIRNADNGDLIPYENVIDLSNSGDNISASFATIDNDTLYAGEFFRNSNYLTNELHHIETADGTNKAYLLGMTLDGTSPVPSKVYSLPDKVQGACFDNGYLYLSISYGAAFSRLQAYDLSKVAQSGTRTVLGCEIPLYILDSTNREWECKISPMSEEIDIVNGKLYVACESASDKYIFGKLTGAKKIYITDIQKLIEKAGLK